MVGGPRRGPARRARAADAALGVRGLERDRRALLSGAAIDRARSGIIDDRCGLDALTKLAGRSLAAGVMAFQGIAIIWLPIGGTLACSTRSPGRAVHRLVVLVSINAVNFVDGLDGLAAGIVGIGAAAFFVVLLRWLCHQRRSPGDHRRAC